MNDKIYSNLDDFEEENLIITKKITINLDNYSKEELKNFPKDYFDDFLND